MSFTIESRLDNIERELKEVKRKIYFAESKKKFFRSAGSWLKIDSEKLKKDIRESRKLQTRKKGDTTSFSCKTRHHAASGTSCSIFSQLSSEYCAECKAFAQFARTFGSMQYSPCCWSSSMHCPLPIAMSAWLQAS